MEIEYHLYEISRSELPNENLSLLNNDQNWIMIDKSNKEKIIIHSGKRIDDTLMRRGITYNYCGLKNYEINERKIREDISH